MKSLRRLLTLSLFFLMFSCKYVHDQYVELINNSSYTLEHWSSNIENPGLQSTIEPGESFIHIEQNLNGKAKDSKGLAPIYYYNQHTDSIVISGGHTLTKNLYQGSNWENEYVGSGRGKDLKLIFSFTDSDLQ